MPDLAVDVRWRPFQLDPTLPPEGKNRERYLLDKFGSPERIADMHARIASTGAMEGIGFAFDRIERAPNTLDCHRLILWARVDGLQNEVVERLFSLYFEQGADLTRAETLVGVARDVGMEADLIEQLLQTDSDLDKTRREIEHAQQMGVTGVPCFIIDQRFAVMGAESSDTLAAALRHAEETRPGSAEA